MSQPRSGHWAAWGVLHRELRPGHDQPGSAGRVINLANGAVAYSYPDYFFFGGNARFNVPGISVDGRISGEFGGGQFQLSGGIRGCVAVMTPRSPAAAPTAGWAAKASRSA